MRFSISIGNRPIRVVFSIYKIVPFTIHYYYEKRLEPDVVRNTFTVKYLISVFIIFFFVVFVNESDNFHFFWTYGRHNTIFAEFGTNLFLPTEVD